MNIVFDFSQILKLFVNNFNKVLLVIYFDANLLNLNHKTDQYKQKIIFSVLNRMNQQKSYYGVQVQSAKNNQENSFEPDKFNYSKLYSSNKFHGTVSQKKISENPAISSEQIMNNLNLSFDGLFSKIQALKGDNTFKTTQPQKKQGQAPKFSWNKYKTPKAHIERQKQIAPFAELGESLRYSKPNYLLKQKLSEQSSPALKTKEQSKPISKAFGGQQKITPKGLSDNTKNAFLMKNFGSIPIMKASMNFPNDDESPTRQESFEVKQSTQDSNQMNLDRVVEKLAEKKSSKAIKQSIFVDSSQLEGNQSEKKPVKIFQMNDFQLGKCIGSGKFGDVFTCQHKQTGFLFAIKKIFKSTILEYDMVKQFTRELRIHYMLDHPNVIKIYAHFEDEYHIFILMEYAQGGILMDRLKCSEQEASRYVSQAINAVEYLHQNHIAHRDIKPENIVLQFNETIKLCDFGWSSFYNNQMKTTFCGTLDYLSPQMKGGDRYDNSVDIWSLGVLTFELLVGHAPYKKQLNVWQRQGSKKSDKCDWNISSESFMRNLLKENPEDRSTLRFSANHTFIRQYRQDPQLNSFWEQFSKII